MPEISPVLESIFSRAAQAGKRIALPDSGDPRSIEAARMALERGICRPVLVAGPDKGTANNNHALETVSAADLPNFDELARCLHDKRQHKGMTEAQARSAAAEPLYLAGLMLDAGLVDGCVAGSLSTTADVLRAGIHTVGLASGMSTISSFFLMLAPDRTLAFADSGVVPDPDARQMADIAIATCANFERLTGQKACAALLAFSTLGSAEHASLHKIRECLKLLRSEQPELTVDGELQFDAAFVPAVAQRKAPDSPVAGRANVFIFPDLNSGNIAYKIAERLGGLQAIGPNVQGLKKPYLDLSRGCSADDIVVSMALASIMAD